MLRVDWSRFGASVRAQTVVDAARYTDVEKRLGISHARMVNAAQGKPLGTDIFLTLCHWLQCDPMWFCDSDGNPKGEDGTASSRSDDSAGPKGHRPGESA